MYNNLIPYRAWDFYLENEDLLEWETMKIAKSISGLYTICMKVCDGEPFIVVYEKGVKDPVCEESFVSEGSATLAVMTIYDKYCVEDEDSYMRAERYEIIRDREEALLDALKNLVEVATNREVGFRDAFRNKSDARDSLDIILEHLAHDRGLVIYRPKFEEIDGEERYIEYPYEEYNESNAGNKTQQNPDDMAQEIEDEELYQFDEDDDEDQFCGWGSWTGETGE